MFKLLRYWWYTTRWAKPLETPKGSYPTAYGGCIGGRTHQIVYSGK